MSVKKLSSLLLALLAVVGSQAVVQAQLFKPFAFPPVTTDYQFFAPRDLDTYGGRPAYRTGWYASYDRLYWAVSRPNDQIVVRNTPMNSQSQAGVTQTTLPDGSVQINNPNGSVAVDGEPLASNKLADFTWGTQFEFGYVDESRKGWAFRLLRVDGPNVNDDVLIERVNRFATPDNGAGGGGGGGGGGGAQQGQLTRPPWEENNPELGARAFLTKNSINVGKLSSFEVNRTWLWKPLHNGGTLEPFAGFRYVKFTNLHRRIGYDRFDVNGVPIPPTDPSQTVQDSAQSELLTTTENFFLNDLVGGQLGIRWTRPYRRWNFYGDVRGFAFENFQNWQRNVDNLFTFYDGSNVDDDVTDITRTTQTRASSRNEFVWGGEVRVNAALEVTRDFALRVGFDWTYFGQGIGRGSQPDANSEDLMLWGVNFGATLNR